MNEIKYFDNIPLIFNDYARREIRKLNNVEEIANGKIE